MSRLESCSEPGTGRLRSSSGSTALLSPKPVLRVAAALLGPPDHRASERPLCETTLA